MITEIEVKNFKTLRDVKIPLAPGITVMVGANNSGKSNALAVLKLVRETIRTQNLLTGVQALGGVDSVLTRGASEPLQVHVKAQHVGYMLSLSRDLDTIFSGETSSLADGRRAERQPRSSQVPLWSFLVQAAVHDLSVAALRAPALVHQAAALGPDGRDVAAVLDDLAGEQPSLRDAIDETVRRAAHEVKRVITRAGIEPGSKVLGIEERDGRIYGAEDMSDGLLLFVGLAVAAQLAGDQPRILAIEEPERGIHPRRLRELIDLLLRLTKTGTQVVLTTHSPTLLDEFRDTPESVLIFDRDEKGTHVTRLSDRPDWASELKGAPLGELWYSGVLGGVPGR